MTRKRSSVIWLTDANDLQNLLNTCSSFAEVLSKLGLNAHSGNHRTLSERIAEDALNTESLNNKRKAKFSSIGRKNKISSHDVLTENSTYGTATVKRKIIEEKLIDYLCEVCKNEGMWNNQKLVLQLEHKNGNHADNRLENLCFLCPNCHSQTKTYAGRNNLKRKLGNFCSCGKQIQSKSLMCKKCTCNQEGKCKFIVAKEDLLYLVAQMSITKIAEKFGVSGNAIRKRCIKFGIDYRKKAGKEI